MTTAYADFTYYGGTYLGASIKSEDFPRLALRASSVIDRLTFDRAKGAEDDEVIDAIRMAMCAVAEEIQAMEQENYSGGIQAESVGSHSVTYASNNARVLSVQSRLENAARVYLEQTGLLYQGFVSGEYGYSPAEDA